MGVRIVLADDHEVVREGVTKLFAASRPDWMVCEEAADGIHALRAIRDLKPDVAVLDITMPGLSGFEVATHVRKLGLPCRLLIFTGHEFDGIAGEVSRVGAHGYVLKSEVTRNLVVAIDALLEGRTFYGTPPGPSQRRFHAAKSQSAHAFGPGLHRHST